MNNYLWLHVQLVGLNNYCTVNLLHWIWVMLNSSLFYRGLILSKYQLSIPTVTQLYMQAVEWVNINTTNEQTGSGNWLFLDMVISLYKQPDNEHTDVTSWFHRTIFIGFGNYHVSIISKENMYSANIYSGWKIIHIQRKSVNSNEPYVTPRVLYPSQNKLHYVSDFMTNFINRNLLDMIQTSAHICI